MNGRRLAVVILSVSSMLIWALMTTLSNSKTFSVELYRKAMGKNQLIIGDIKVNGELIGNSYEHSTLKIPAGEYKGIIRYFSPKGFAQSRLGKFGKTGDFLLEVSGIDGKTDILFHGGNMPHHTQGCILLGPVMKDPTTGNGYIDDPDHPLRKLRILFYGT